MREKIKELLFQFWKHSEFRPLQEEIICSVLDKKDTLALLPTGGGKSICFQVPALAMDGLCIVISPLIALMKDQVENLKSKGIEAAAIYSGMHKKEIELTINQAIYGPLKFLYLSPERLETKDILLNIHSMNVCLLAVDEAHCISQWGYDFRPPYLRITEFRKLLPSTPILALTATATPEVVIDIQEKLNFPQPNVFQKSFKRENLTYYVIEEEDKLDRMLRIIKKIRGSGVVYVRNRKKTEEIAAFLMKSKLSATCYHAGLDPKIKNKRQSDWILGKTSIMVATNAFGMGIDKPNVRFVIHLDLPDSLEAYFQEAGRGGRDGLRAFAVLLYHPSDRINLEKQFELTYPSAEFIKRVYDALGNFFQIHVGSGKDQSFPFDFYTFQNAYHFSPIECFNALKILEKEGLILLSEPHLPSSKLWINCDYTELYKIQVEKPNLNLFIQTILRNYGGQIYDQFVKINEKELAKQLNSTEEKIIQAIKLLSSWKLIEYLPAPIGLQLSYLEDRLDISKLSLSNEHYHSRKKIAAFKLDRAIDYAENKFICRSQLLLSYFGEKESAPCHRCDVCVKKNNLEVSPQEFEELFSCIKPFMIGNPFKTKDIYREFPQFSEIRINKVLQLLKEQEQIKITDSDEYIFVE